VPRAIGALNRQRELRLGAVSERARERVSERCPHLRAELPVVAEQLGVTVSMSRKGNCWDSAVAESFFATIKRELLGRERWTSRLHVRDAVFDYIETFYNRRRRTRRSATRPQLSSKTTTL
jgi:transposase InsO family protein